MSIEIFKHSTDFESFAAGATIFKEGDDPAGQMYVLQAGEIDIEIGGKHINTLNAGDCLGEIALVDAGPRSATAVARTDVRLVAIDRKRFIYLVTQTPHFALQVMQAMAERLRSRTEH